MDWKKIALGTAAYTAVTFPLAVVWHVVLFKQKYLALQFGIFGVWIGLIYRSTEEEV